MESGHCFLGQVNSCMESGHCFLDTLNLRGSDIQYNPVFFSYLVITSQSVVLFWKDGNLPGAVTDQLSKEGVTAVEGRPYDDIVDYLVRHAGEGVEKPLNLISETSPVCLNEAYQKRSGIRGLPTMPRSRWHSSGTLLQLASLYG
ncbi:hypothetical protein ACJJTC_013679 [Scirpophaga incertulas]